MSRYIPHTTGIFDVVVTHWQSGSHIWQYLSHSHYPLLCHRTWCAGKFPFIDVPSYKPIGMSQAMISPCWGHPWHGTESRRELLGSPRHRLDRRNPRPRVHFVLPHRQRAAPQFLQGLGGEEEPLQGLVSAQTRQVLEMSTHKLMSI